MKREVVEVEWVDSMSARGWRSESEIKELFAEIPLMRSVGYLLKKNKDKIALGCSVDGSNGNINQYHEIPMCAVKTIRKLKS
jgi:hypothetical protein